MLGINQIFGSLNNIPCNIRAQCQFEKAARRVERDVKGVHGDFVARFSKRALLDRAEDGAIEFPYEGVKVEFLLRAT